MLNNLLSNAVKCTDSGSVILKVTFSPIDADCGADVRNARFEVIDTGIGISPEEQERIFAPFQQAEGGKHRGGTGLGLVICQKHITLMGGELHLESELGKGSRFFFEIPLPPATVDENRSATERRREISEIADGAEVSALVVDDLVENRDVLATLLRGVGVGVTTAASASEALRQMQTRRPDVAFIDIYMPETDGIELMQRIREKFHADCPKLVAVSASVFEQEEGQILDAGFDEFIPKPFEFERLCQCLIDQLGVTFADRESGWQQQDWSKIQLPNDLLNALIEATERRSLTQVKAYVAEMESLDSKSQQLANHLQTLIQTLEFDKIVKILNQLEVRRKD